MDFISYLNNLNIYPAINERASEVFCEASASNLQIWEKTNQLKERLSLVQELSEIEPLKNRVKKEAISKKNSALFELKNLDQDKESYEKILSHLLFLALCPVERQKELFSAEERKIIEDSCFWNTINDKGIKYGLIPLVGLSLSGFLGFLALAQKLSSLEQVSVATSIAATANIACVILSFLFTGTFPHKASEHHNRRQDAIYDLHNDYDELSKRLLQLYTSRKYRPLAKELAESIASRCPGSFIENKSPLYEKAAALGLEHAEIHRIFNTLDETTVFIRFGKTSGNSLFDSVLKEMEEHELNIA